VIEASIPSDIFALEGDLLVTVQSDDRITTVDAATKISGQLSDWGKSKRVLKRFFARIREFAELERGSPASD
jgi:hypothetical protein